MNHNINNKFTKIIYCLFRAIFARGLSTAKCPRNRSDIIWCEHAMNLKTVLLINY